MPNQPEARVFTDAFKTRGRLVISTAITVAAAAPFAAGLVILAFLVSDPMGWVAASVTAGAFVAAGTLTWVIQDRLTLYGNAGLRARVRELAAAAPAFRACPEPSFVGFAPGDQVRSWQGETDLDVGFLCLAEGTLVFLGDCFTWSLPRARIDAIDLTASSHLGPARIIIRWHAPREPRRALTLEGRDARSLRQAEAATAGLFRRLREWALVEAAEDAATYLLGAPPTGEYGGRLADEPASGWCGAVVGMGVIITLTTWYLARQMLEQGYYYHAILWSGFVVVGGAVFTRCLLHYLQSAAPPRRVRERPRMGGPPLP